MKKCFGIIVIVVPVFLSLCLLARADGDVGFARPLARIESIDAEKTRIGPPAPSSEYPSPEELQKALAATVIVIAQSASGKTRRSSGFIFDQTGLIATSFHGIVGAADIQVRLHQGAVYPVEMIIGYDAMRDICIMKIQTREVVPVLFLSSWVDGTVDSRVFAIGAPVESDCSVSYGTYKGWESVFGIKHLVFSADISPGYSGGPLVDLKTRALGVVTSIVFGRQARALAIPVSELNTLRDHPQNLSLAQFNGQASAAYPVYYEALEAYFSDDLDVARELFLKALDRDRSLVEASYGLGLVYQRMHMPDEAIAAFTQVLSVKEDSSDAYRQRGLVYYEDKKMLLEALRDFSAAIAADPNDAASLSARGVAYHKMGGQGAQAVADFSAALAIDPQSDVAYNNRGLVYLSDKSYERARADFTEAISLNPRSFQSYYNRGLASQEQMDHESAVADFHRALASGGLNKEIVYSRGVSFFELKRYDEAISDLSNAIALDPTYSDAYFKRGLVYYSGKQLYSLALSDFSQVIFLNPQYLHAYLYKARACFKAGEYGIAINTYLKYLVKFYWGKK